MTQAPSTLAEIALAIPGAILVGDATTLVSRVTFDSRLVHPGDFFVALPGTVEDGAAYVSDAIHRGAGAVAVENHQALPPGAVGLVVPSARRALGLIASALEGWPSRSLRVVGVTGTDGKTTTTTMISSILKAAGRKVGLVTTVNAEIGGEAVDTGLHTTTPDAPDLQSYLRRMVDTGTEDAVLEVTSHGLAQERVAGCDFDLAVITNVTGDHLDYHQTFEAYLDAKLSLFRGLDRPWRKSGVPTGAVYNLDDISADSIVGLRFDRRLSYALRRPAEVWARDVTFDSESATFVAETPAGSFSLRIPFVGWYNIANCLAAVSAGLLLDAPVKAIQDGLAGTQRIPGRLEPIHEGQSFDVFVDFAHTANSLEQVLSLCRARCRQRLSVVFGCAGRRDRQKRTPMGKVAAQYADRIYLTAEDPRTESLDAIIEEIAVGCQAGGRRDGVDFWRVPDREEAIERAIQEANDGDIVLIAGKGHERSMCFGVTEMPWNDAETARQALLRR